MKSNKKDGRIIGLLLLFIFISGVIIFQFLQNSLFSDDFITSILENSNKIILSVVLGILNGIASIIIAVILLPIFKKYSVRLAYLYFAFTILNFIAIMIDNVSVVSMLEFSKEYLNNNKIDSIASIKNIIYQKHWWTHYFYLLISCFPVFVLYLTFYISKLIPRGISIFGLIAVILMFIEELFSIFGHGISMNMLLPIALVQITLPIWLLLKGLRSPLLKSE